MKQATVDLLRELTDVNGVPGFEDQVAQIVEQALGDFTEVSRDNLGSVICAKDGGQGGPSAGSGSPGGARRVQSRGAPKVMLAGHMDEIGFMVQFITKEGFVKFVPLGGWWGHVVLAQRVVVHTQKGPVHGIVGSKPPHVLEEQERNKVRKLKDMFIDVGAKNEKEATSKFGIRPGDPIVPWSPFTRLSNRKLLAGKAFDDRVGVGMFVEALKALKGKKHPNVVYGVGTVQEEVGLRGAQTSAHSVDPDVALIMEVAIAGDVPGFADEERQVKLGGGPALYLLEGSAIPNFRLRELAIEICTKKKIPYATALMPRGGTDAGRIHVHARGVPSLVIGVPTRHIHSHTGIMHADDFDNAVKLVVELIKRLDAKTVAGLVA